MPATALAQTTQTVFSFVSDDDYETSYHVVRVTGDAVFQVRMNYYKQHRKGKTFWRAHAAGEDGQSWRQVDVYDVKSLKKAWQLAEPYFVKPINVMNGQFGSTFTVSGKKGVESDSIPV